MIKSLNSICASALLESLESSILFDEDSDAIDVVSGKFSDEEENEDLEALHGSNDEEDGGK